MANEEHLAILRQGVQVWNEWRKENPHIKPDLTRVRFKRLSNYDKANFSETNLSEADFSGNFLNEINFSKANLIKVNLGLSNLHYINFNRANLSEAIIVNAYINETNFSAANLSKANLYLSRFINSKFNKANLANGNCFGSLFIKTDFTEANLQQTNFSATQALGTIFTRANLTGICIEAWNINDTLDLDQIICEYIYLKDDPKERYPSNRNFALGEFTKLFQKSLETVDLIFRNGIDWDAFAYSFKKVEVENQGAQLDVQSIEKKGDGILLVRVAVAPDADKAKIHSEFMQGYEFAAKALDAQYQARLEDKNTIITRQEVQINRLFDIVEQQGSVQKALVENPRKVSKYSIHNPQFAGGFVDAETANAKEIGGKFYNTDNNKNPD
ncbi:pentapeptide repeat-containing protein [Nostoc sp.]|uniref:pentapeptide repeat-containing protein n=1 Tax=Nostoc sp. TaxID=1180 RepID=UPI002FF3F9FA